MELSLGENLNGNPLKQNIDGALLYLLGTQPFCLG